MKYKYMRDNLKDEHNFLPLQDKILEIMVNIDKICKKNNIEYCLMGGSALGAKRHGGFIPWDDDLDIFMTPDNYEKLRTILKDGKTLPNYYLQEWGLVDGMVTISKIRDNNTTYIESSLKNWKMHHGIYIDIFILHVSPDSKILQLKQCFWAKYVVLKSLANKGYTKRKGAAGILLKFMRLFPKSFLIKHGLKQVYKYRDRTTNYYCNFLGKAGYKKGLYRKDIMYPFKSVKFEKVDLMVPAKIDDFLKCRFGDYMKIPSPEQIKWNQHAEIWDVNKSYTKVTNNDSKEDEVNLM